MKSIFTPQIVRETHNGYSCYDIAVDMLTRRKITCSNEITAETVDSLISQILCLAHEDPKEEITFYINSNEGEASSDLAF